MWDAEPADPEAATQAEKDAAKAAADAYFGFVDN